VEHRVLVFAEAVDVAAEGAVWYARRIGGGDFAAVHVRGKHTDSGIHARWFDLTGGEPRLDVRPPESDATAVVLGEVARLRDGGATVTVVLPEQFRKRSLMAAAQRAQFRLKLRLLVEPHVVVADVPAVTSERRPEGHVPDRLVVRVLVDEPDDATHGAVRYARALPGVDDLRALHLGERRWDEADLGIPVDDAPLPGRLGDAILAEVRKLTADPGAAVNVVLPERLRPQLRLLRNRQALAVKRCLLFEPHVILSSVPHRD
jgi:nucleotide-binding universal stress UspA family protein